MLYEDIFHNCVFVGFDETGKPRYASTRATNGKSDDKREASGSDKRYSFRILHPSDTLHVFEGAIDLLSYMTLTKITDGKWTREAMVSLGGVAASKCNNDTLKVPIALQSAIENMKELKRIYPGNLVMIGDRASDLEAARTVGCPFVGCSYGYGTPEFLKDVPTNYDALRAQKHTFKHHRRRRKRK